jgi:predicted TIM-barrel fold metal-dependent hydrolase
MHPQVYVDLGVIDWSRPQVEFHRYLQRLVEAGYEDRIMFGSDQMVWPETIGLAVDAVDAAPFLTTVQKRKIFYENARRFMRVQ